MQYTEITKKKWSNKKDMRNLRKASIACHLSNVSCTDGTATHHSLTNTIKPNRNTFHNTNDFSAQHSPLGPSSGSWPERQLARQSPLRPSSGRVAIKMLRGISLLSVI